MPSVFFGLWSIGAESVGFHGALVNGPSALWTFGPLDRRTVGPSLLRQRQQTRAAVTECCPFLKQRTKWKLHRKFRLPLLGAMNQLLGLLLLASPVAAALAVPFVFGVLLLIEGVALIVWAFRVR